MRKIVCMISLCLVVISLTNCKGRGENSDKAETLQTTTNGQSTEKAQAETKNQVDQEDTVDSIGIDPHSPYWYDPTISEPTFSEDRDTLWYFPRKKKGGDYIVPDGVKYVQGRAFLGCEKLRSVVFPKSMTHMEMATFESCPMLEKVVFKGVIDEIPFRGFNYCPKLKEIHLVNRRPPSIWNSENEFEDDEEIINFTFSEVNMKKCKIYVPKGCAKRYKRARIWKRFKHIVEE